MNPVKKGKLLIIDDESELLEILEDIFSEYVAEIHTAKNGEEAIQILKTQQFNAVLSDEKMPKKTGLDVLIWMKSQGIETPFIIHSGYGQKEVVEKARALQVYDFLDKPWQETKLIAVVTEAIAKDLDSK